MSSQLDRDRQQLETQNTSLFDLVFRDNKGDIVIAQAPNLPVLVGLITTFLQFLLPSGNIHLGLKLVAFGALFTWAWQELFEGVNYFRRGLGLISLGGLLALSLKLGGI
ncbi:hypothetical protein [Nodosilinea sp. E11]|uniref:hypothetical protein n=1 Tax=Nodosilinea sp. E11 TaxID=3037479 RepID=UPI00293500D6|nr:hypothetical protein [Nodosilinea sp. E11]WOD39857.1 hypothetical protein RRF56_03520 [Nodosilinea sp. E11]